MTPEEIEDDWECQTFGEPLKDAKSANQDASDYANFINDFITGRSKFDHMPAKSKLPSNVISALKVFDLGVSASWREVGAKYRALAKKYHPDTATDKKNAATEFAKISTAYDILKKHFGKK
jgi:DnaJ-class molecular chaperone